MGTHVGGGIVVVYVHSPSALKLFARLLPDHQSEGQRMHEMKRTIRNRVCRLQLGSGLTSDACTGRRRVRRSTLAASIPPMNAQTHVLTRIAGTLTSLFVNDNGKINALHSKNIEVDIVSFCCCVSWCIPRSKQAASRTNLAAQHTDQPH